MSEEPLLSKLKFKIDSGKYRGTDLIDLQNQYGWELSRLTPRDAYQLSIEVYQQALDHNYLIGQIESLRNSAQCLRLFSDYPGSLEHGLRALKLSEKIDNNLLKAELYNLIGAVHMHQGEPDIAVDYYSKCLEINKSEGNHEGVLKSMNSIGDLYLRQKKYKKALSIFEDCLKIESTNKTMIGIVTYNMGETYFYLNELAKSYHYLKKAILIGNELSFALMTVYCEALIGEIHIKKKEYDSAIKHVCIALEAAEGVEAKDRIYRCHKLLYTIYKLKNDYKLALKHCEQYHEIKEELFNEENNNKIKNLQFQLETEAIKRETEVERKKNQELKLAYGKIEEQNESIRSSINYAKRIQDALLPGDKVLTENLKDYFVLYEPKDIVSGDFYWFNRIEDKLFFAVVDCTGHGVPGAFMSIVGNNGLNLAALQKFDTPSAMLGYLDIHVSETLKETRERKALSDGMDIGLCSLNRTERILEFSGAYNPMYVITSDEKIIDRYIDKIKIREKEKTFLEFKGNKTPIGNTRLLNKEKTFEQVKLKFEKDAIIYLISDGYADQFGGEENTKYTYKRLRELLFTIHNQDLNKQKEILYNRFKEWKGSSVQIDDVCIIGVRV